MCAHASADVYTHVCTYLHRHECTEVQARVCTHVYTHVFTHGYTIAYTCIHIHVQKHVRAQVYARVYANDYTQICTHVYTQAREATKADRHGLILERERLEQEISSLEKLVEELSRQHAEAVDKVKWHQAMYIRTRIRKL